MAATRWALDPGIDMRVEPIPDPVILDTESDYEAPGLYIFSQVLNIFLF